MSRALRYGVPIAASLATGGYALSQGEDPGSAGLAAGLGGLGAAGGLLGARLAGKYSPQLVSTIQEKAVIPAGNVIGNVGRDLPESSKVRAGAVGKAADVVNALEQMNVGPKAERNISKGLAAGMVPASAAAAGLGGVALGAVPGAMGMPGFQQGIDPESYTSSNMPGARQSISTLQY